MHFHHYTLNHLADVFRSQYLGEKVYSCISQNKNELVVELESVYLRIGCHTPLTFLVPVDVYSRARKNVVNLFPELLGKCLQAVKVLEAERVMILEFEEELNLILKMHGIGANVMLSEADKITRLFRQQRDEDWGYEPKPGLMDRTKLEASPAMVLPKVLEALRSISLIYDKSFAQRTLFFMEKGQAFSQAFESVLSEVNQPLFYLLKEKDRIRFLLFPQEGAIEIKGVEVALQTYLKTFFQFKTYTNSYKTLSNKLQKPLKKFRKVYKSYLSNINNLTEERNQEELGHILMANLHQMEGGKKKISLPDFYGEGEIEIKLNPTLSPQANAENYYKKHKQRKLKVAYLKTQLADIEEKLKQAEADWAEFEKVKSPEELNLEGQGFDSEELKILRRLYKFHAQEEAIRSQNRYPYRTFRKDGYDIFVGKNARNNDELSFKFASKEDLWLHAKDVAGSHVIIRQQAGKPLPSPVLEYAAQLAAFYSKRKNDSIVPVLYTSRKYIRKRKGDPPGKVAVDRESVIMVEPIRN